MLAVLPAPRRFARSIDSPAVRVLLWHGWLLEGTGSNVYTARVAEMWRRGGHDVVLLCQERRVERLAFVDAWGTVDPHGVSELTATGTAPEAGKVTLLRPDIGRLLPVFVYDDYPGFQVKTFVDLTDEELESYLERGAAAIRRVADRHPPDAVVTGHAMAGPPIALRGLGAGSYAAKVHGSDLEYAVRIQRRYRELAKVGLEGARRVAGASRDVLGRAEAVAPGIRGRTTVVPPGVEIDRWRPLSRTQALERAAALLQADPDTARGRAGETDSRVVRALAGRDGDALDRLARAYDQEVPDREAPARLRALAGHRGPLVGYLGKLIPEKGVERFLEALALLGPDARGLVIGFGTFREWLTALVEVMDRGDTDGWGWLREASPMQLELGRDEVVAARGLGARVTFTGRLDHRYAPEAVAAMDALVVPSTLGEAFGMVAAEAAAAGVPPVVARHSALAEVARALEEAAGSPGLLSFEPGPGATRRLAGSLVRLQTLSPPDARTLRTSLRRHVTSEWTWDRTAARLLDAATR
jgi:glycosyltransferase involved in cell wall biosynthesis